MAQVSARGEGADTQRAKGSHILLLGRKQTFWLVFIALVISFFVVLLENAAVATALPTIAHDLHVAEFSWIGTSYGLFATAPLPFSGDLAEIFGRRPVMLGSMAIFGLGSALAGSAQNFAWMISARIIQGLGGGGIVSLSTIIVSDLVPLKERGLYNGLLSLTWSVAGGIGPFVGGALAQQGQWRWLFYLTLPLAGVAFALVAVFLRLPTPPGTLQEKVAKIDVIGNVLVITSSVSLVIGITWGGIQFPWSSVQVLVPLSLGLAGLGFFLLYEAKWCANPMVPFHILSNRTTLSGYFQIILLSISYVSLVYYLPVYYQACKGASPTASGVDLFGIAFVVSPITIITGVTIHIFKRYRGLIWVGWSITTVGFGLFTTLKADTSRGISIGSQAITAAGIGLVYSSTYFPVLAPLPVSSNAQAVSFYVFLRSFGQIWGVALGGTVLQNELKRKLPNEILSQFNGGVEIAYSIIPMLPTLPQPTLQQVRDAFASSLSVFWMLNTAIVGFGLLTSLPMAGLPLHVQTDSRWDLDNEQNNTSEAALGSDK